MLVLADPVVVEIASLRVEAEASVPDELTVEIKLTPATRASDSIKPPVIPFRSGRIFNTSLFIMPVLHNSMH